MQMDQARASSRRQDCFLVCPTAQVGGGMGQVVTYLIDHGASHMPLRPVALDARGPGALIWSPWYLLLAITRVAAGALSGRLALIHLHVAERGSLVRKGLVALVARALGVKTLLHLHAAEIRPFYDGLPGWAQAMVRFIFRRADLCVVLGNGWRDWLIETIGVAPARIVVLRNGVPRPMAPDSAPPMSKTPDAPFRILFLGNLTPRKGVGDLLAALATLRTTHRFEAVFAGGGQVDAYRTEADRLGLASIIEFPGWVDRAQAAALTAGADVLVLPSYHEGLPLVILEALGAGVPVICTPVGSIPEVLTDQQTALLVPPGDIPALAAALRRLIEQPAVRASLASAGRDLYDREFTMDGFVTGVAALYRRLLADAKS